LTQTAMRHRRLAIPPPKESDSEHRIQIASNARRDNDAWWLRRP
jgi:hypothetical protein